MDCHGAECDPPIPTSPIQSPWQPHESPRRPVFLFHFISCSFPPFVNTLAPGPALMSVCVHSDRQQVNLSAGGSVLHVNEGPDLPQCVGWGEVCCANGLFCCCRKVTRHLKELQLISPAHTHTYPHIPYLQTASLSLNCCTAHTSQVISAIIPA